MEMNLLGLFLLRTERLYLPTKIRFIQNMTLLFMERLAYSENSVLLQESQIYMNIHCIPAVNPALCVVGQWFGLSWEDLFMEQVI